MLSDERNLIPLKKPKLTDQELKEKVLINILKPLQKPKLVKEIVEEIPIAGIQNNVFSTLNLCKVSKENNIKKMMVSTFLLLCLSLCLCVWACVAKLGPCDNT